MRNVIGTAPSMLGASAAATAELWWAAACAGTYDAMMVAAAVLPLVLRNLRRVGSKGPDLGSSGMGVPPIERTVYRSESAAVYYWRETPRQSHPNNCSTLLTSSGESKISMPARSC